MTLKTWVLADHKIGTQKQCVALAEALKLEPVMKFVQPKPFWSRVPSFLIWNPLSALDPEKSSALEEPWPKVIIAGGRAAAAPTAYLKKILGDKVLTLFLQNPHMNLSKFDLVIAPRHDDLKAPNIIQTEGALHNVTPARLKAEAEQWSKILPPLSPRPWVAVLLGGNSRHHSMTPEMMEYYGTKIRQLALRHPFSLLITPSRRTPPDALQAFKASLGDTSYYLWNELGENPYYGYLGLADYILVTNDSISMVSEAVSTGKPVYLLELDGGSERFNKFFENMEKTGRLRVFEGALENWSYTPPDDLKKIVATVAPLLKKMRNSGEAPAK